MKKFTCRFLALGMALALTAGTLPAAFAAEENAITVQLDGQALSFTDAVPQVRDQRTFLPFRAVFEAMGAQVDYEGSVITATRDGKTLTMTLNETTATVTQDGKTTNITMDVAPYVDNATWRTYVPVRFAAQAFDCAVGWDQRNSTAIIVDTDKLVDNTLEGKKFTYLEKFMDYSEKYNKGIWDMKASFDADMTVLTMPMTVNGAMTGTMQDADKMSMDMNMKMDLTELIKAVALLAGQSAAEMMDAEDQAMLDALKTNGVDIAMRGDLAAGTLYMNMKGLPEGSGMDENAWYKLDMAALMELAGMDWGELMASSKAMDYTSLVKTALSTLEPTDSTTAYTQVKDTAEQVAKALSDEGFVNENGTYTAIVDAGEDTNGWTVVLSLSMKNNEVTGYSMGMHMGTTEDGTTVSMDMTTGMNENGEMKATVGMNMGELLFMSMIMEGSYAAGKTAPAVEPPAGATVVDMVEMMNAELSAEESASLGVIGGADGPTSIFLGQ